MAVIIKDGIIGRASGSFRGDILIDGEKIAAVGGSIYCGGAEVVNAAGRYLLPGGVDPHTHVMLRVGENSVSDGFKAATRAALFGGTTTIVEHPSFEPQEAPLSAAVERTAAEGIGRSYTDFGIHLVFQRYGDDIAAELPTMTEAGFPTGKVYTTYGGRLTDEEIFPLMLAMKEAGGLLLYHCENNAVTNGLAAMLSREMPAARESWPLSRPDYCEAEAVRRVLALSRAAGVPAYIVHLSTKEGLEEAIRARRAGQMVYLETCPQYLTLTEECYKRDNGLDFVMAPPLRKSGDCDRLWRALGQGDIDAVGTDHCSFSRADKERLGAENVFKSPGGVPGIETRMELLFSEGVMKNRLSLERFVAVTATNPASILGLRDKGRIEAGADADLILIDPEKSGILSAESLHQAVDYTPYEGIMVNGRVTDVWLRGARVVEEGRLTAERPAGRLLKRRL
ncbi:MAG: dihydropyrimidinase [Synergistaceae bacterium]|nr:dihydropyrimidinase [Synergistaceae bacterium]